jgi:dihydrofolate synthase/folylpolyglutamate synthase
LSTYDETLRYLYALQRRGMKFGLRNTRELLRTLGNPQRKFRSVHIAGTNGKGSTSAFLASMAMEAGLKTGLYTSPHLFRFTERIRVNGMELSEDRLVYYVKELRRAIETVHATFFEATTCVAFRYFADEQVELAVVETGLGGRFDSTNVLHPLISIITSIGLDHTEYLGTTPEEIAAEKGGIIKVGVPVILGNIDQRPLHVLKLIAKRRKSRIIQATRSLRCTLRMKKGDHILWFTSGSLRNSSARLGLGGAYQVSNAQAAVAAFAQLQRQGVVKGLTKKAVRNGLGNVVKNTGLRGRLERINSPEGSYIFDVAHNPDGMRSLGDTLASEHLTPAVVVFGAMADKNIQGMLLYLRRLCDSLIATAPAMERALPAAGIRRLARDAGFEVEMGRRVSSAVRRARKLVGRGVILVTGSHYVVAEGLKALQRHNS